MFATVRVFKVSTRMGTIKNKMAEGLLELAIRERKLASRILTDIQDPGLVNGKLASRIFRIQDL